MLFCHVPLGVRSIGPTFTMAVRDNVVAKLQADAGQSDHYALCGSCICNQCITRLLHSPNIV